MINLNAGEIRTNTGKDGKTYQNITLFINGLEVMPATKKDGTKGSFPEGTLKGRIGRDYLEKAVAECIATCKKEKVEFIDVVAVKGDREQVKELSNKLKEQDSELQALKAMVAKLQGSSAPTVTEMKDAVSQE